MKKSIVVFFVVFIISTGTLSIAQAIPDMKKLSTFYQLMGKMYGTLKKTTDDFLKHKITANTYREKMSNWKSEYDRNDPIAPCPKNKWQTQYSQLTPLHYKICFAWGDLQGLHTALSLTDSEMVVYHETEFRKGMQKALKMFEHPQQNKEDDLFE